MLLPRFCISDVAVCRTIFCHVPDGLEISAANASALDREDIVLTCVQDGRPVELMLASAFTSILWLGATGVPRCTCGHDAQQQNRSNDVVFGSTGAMRAESTMCLETGRFGRVGDYVQGWNRMGGGP